VAHAKKGEHGLAYEDLGYALHGVQDRIAHGQCCILPNWGNIHTDYVDNIYLDPYNWNYANHVAGKECYNWIALQEWNPGGARYAATLSDTLAFLRTYAQTVYAETGSLDDVWGAP
jgi:hypothetical protein